MVQLSSLRFEVLPSEDVDSVQPEDNAPDEAELSDPEEPFEDTAFIEELESESCTAIVASQPQVWPSPLYTPKAPAPVETPPTLWHPREQSWPNQNFGPSSIDPTPKRRFDEIPDQPHKKIATLIAVLANKPVRGQRIGPSPANTALIQMLRDDNHNLQQHILKLQKKADERKQYIAEYQPNTNVINEKQLSEVKGLRQDNSDLQAQIHALTRELKKAKEHMGSNEPPERIYKDKIFLITRIEMLENEVLPELRDQLKKYEKEAEAEPRDGVEKGQLVRKQTGGAKIVEITKVGELDQSVIIAPPNSKDVDWSQEAIGDWEEYKDKKEEKQSLQLERREDLQEKYGLKSKWTA